MFVCICNAIRDRELKAAACPNVRGPAELMQRCGHRPQCGKCFSEVSRIIDKSRESCLNGDAG